MRAHSFCFVSPSRSPDRLANLSPQRLRYSYSDERLSGRLNDMIYSAPTYQKWGSSARSFLAPTAAAKKWTAGTK